MVLKNIYILAFVYLFHIFKISTISLRKDLHYIKNQLYLKFNSGHIIFTIIILEFT